MEVHDMTRKQNQALFMLLPFLILVTIFYIFPALITIGMAFTELDASFIWSFAGLDNFRRIFLDPNTVPIIINTFLYVACTIVLTIIIDVILAILTTYFIQNDKVSTIFKSLYLVFMREPSGIIQ